jgi:hypothetical protein
MSDGGEDVRQVQASLHPNREQVIDWFHNTMRLQPQTMALQAERPDEGVAASKPIESVQPRLWHGHGDEALDGIDRLFIDGDLIRRPSELADQLAVGIAELRTYIRNHRGSIPNYLRHEPRDPARSSVPASPPMARSPKASVGPQPRAPSRACASNPVAILAESRGCY